MKLCKVGSVGRPGPIVSDIDTIADRAVQMAEIRQQAGKTGLKEAQALSTYPLVNIQKAIENGHWNSGVSH